MGIGSVSWTSVVANAIGQKSGEKTLPERSKDFDEKRLEYQARLTKFNDADYVVFDRNKKLLSADEKRAQELRGVIKTAPKLDKEYSEYMKDFKEYKDDVEKETDGKVGGDLTPFNFEEGVKKSFDSLRKGLANVINANFNPEYSKDTLESIKTSEPPDFLKNVGELFSQLFNSRIKDIPDEKRTYMEPLPLPEGDELGSVDNPFKPTRLNYKGGVQYDKTLNDLNDIFRNDGLIEGKFLGGDLMVLPTNDYNRGLGYPESLFFEQDENGNGVKLSKAPQRVKYVDPFDNKMKDGIYLEAEEPAGPKGDGGVNKILIADGAPRAAIIPTTFTYGDNGKTKSVKYQGAELIEAKKAGRTE